MTFISTGFVFFVLLSAVIFYLFPAKKNDFRYQFYTFPLIQKNTIEKQLSVIQCITRTIKNVEDIFFIKPNAI